MLNIIRIDSYQPVPDTCRPQGSHFWRLPNMPGDVLPQVRREDCPRHSPQSIREIQAEKKTGYRTVRHGSSGCGDGLTANLCHRRLAALLVKTE